MEIWQLLILIHLLGLTLALGGAAVKIALLVALRASGDVELFLRVARPISRLIIAGMVLVTGSGIVWLVQGRHFTPLLVGKLVLAGAVWVLGPIIDNVLEPRLRAAATGPAERLEAARRTHFVVEIVATGLLLAVTVMGVLV